MQSHGRGVLPDYIGSALLALTATAALEHREISGQGQRVEVCQIDGQAAMNAEQICNDPHLRTGGHIVEVVHTPLGRPLRPRLPASPGISQARADLHASWLGNDDYVFGSALGLFPEEIPKAVLAGNIR